MLITRSSLLAASLLVASGCGAPLQWTIPTKPLVPLGESPSGGATFTFCPTPPADAPVQLTNALWLSFFAANEYAHGAVVGPMLNELGFYNPDRPLDRAWATCLDDLRHLREVERAKEATLADPKRTLREHTLSLLPGDGSWGSCVRELAATATFRKRSLPSGALQEQLVHRAERGAYLQFFSARASGEDRWFKDGSTQFVIARHKDLPVVIIAFRGTEPGQFADVAVDLNLFLARLDEHGWPAGWGSVHAGFHRAFLEVESLLSAKLDELEGSGVRIWITGHSLGAALGTLAAARILRAQDEGAKLDLGGLYAFGSPRVGDREFAAALGERAARRGVPIVRVRNDNDVVTAIPGEGFGYAHVGTLIHLTEGKLLIGPAPDPAYARFSVADHHAAGWVDGLPASGYYRRLKLARDSGAHAAIDRCPPRMGSTSR